MLFSQIVFIPANVILFIFRLGDQSGFKVNPQQFNDYELMIATHLVVPADITVSWNDIAGLDNVIQELRESVVLPVRHRDLFNHVYFTHLDL